MTSCDFGDIVIVPFPFTDQSSIKRRPAAIISSRDYTRDTGNAIILAISSKGGRKLDRPVSDWQTAGLLKPSFLKPVITTIEISLVLRKLGSLSEADVSTFEEMIGNLLARRSGRSL